MLYFYYGANTFLLEEKLRIFKERYFIKHPHSLNFHTLDLAEVDSDALRALFETQSLFLETTLVFVRGISHLSSTGSENLVEILKETSVGKREDVVVVFVEREEKKTLSKIKKLFSYLLSSAHVQEFVPYSGAQLLNWVSRYITERGGVIDSDAATELIGRSGEQMLVLSHELEKLFSYSGGEKISREMVKKLIPKAIHTDIFETIHALGERKTEKAINLLYEHKDVGDDPFQLLGMFAYEVRTLLLIKEAMDEGRVEELKSLGTLHPFVIQKNSALCSAFSLDELVRLHGTLAHADFSAKTGEKEPYEALEDVIFAFSEKD